MIILGEIQSALPDNYKNKKTGELVKQIRLIVMDRSKHYRCMTPFYVTMSPDKFAENFPKKNPGDLTDEKCTLVATKMAGFGDGINCPQALLRLGHIAPEVFASEAAKATV